MKKLLALLAVALTAAPFFADIYFPHRFVDIGVDVSAEVSQNLYGATEVLVKDLVIDFNKIYDNMDDGGFIFKAGEEADLFARININGYGLGVELSESVASSINISKELFGLLANGNELDKPTDVGLGFSMESYISTSIPVYLKFGNLKITAKPSCFLPIAYMPRPDAKVTYTMNSDGIIRVDANADVNMYSIIDLSSAITSTSNGEGTPSTSFDFTSIMNDPLGMLQEIPSFIGGNAGFDLAVQAEYPIVEKVLDLGGYVSVPVFPGRLDNKLSFSASAYAETTSGVLDHYSAELTKPESERSNEIPFEYDYSFSNFAASKADEPFTINRPLRIGIEAAYRPFGGTWFTFHPKLGVAIRNPFGKDFDWASSIFPEYSLSIDLSFFSVINASISTQYIDKVFMHSVGFSLNARILELRLALGTGSTEFMKSFKLSGLQASVGVSMGI
ncbi:MAG: hypothetical protein II716_11205 [Treponema sp.]|nr:hypothetical protein [Treponema sp.]MBQ5384941.1 hypothetical protein [Treponema sp.]